MSLKIRMIAEKVVQSQGFYAMMLMKSKSK